MNSLLFILKRSFTNRLKRELKKPKTYILGAGVIWYIISIVFVLAGSISNIKTDKEALFVAGFSSVMIFCLCTNVFTYIKKKGLIFTKADINFCCCSPVNPKQILIYAGYRNFIGNIFLTLMGFYFGCFSCNIPWFKVLLLSVSICVLETILEISVIIILYGSEKVTPAISFIIRGVLMCCILALFVIGVCLCIKEQSILAGFNGIFNKDYILAVPIIGWNVALIRLIILGPTLLNVISSIIYLICVFLIAVIAFKISCNGEYFEVAMTFAEDYAIALQKGKNGEIAVIGKKNKFKRASVNYKGSYAKSIYYKQLLEAKKQRFGKYGLGVYIFLLAGIAIAAIVKVTELPITISIYVIPGVSLYINCILSSMKSKLELELKNPYTYLIPDTNFKKLLYSTLIDIERSLLEGVFLVLPSMFIAKINPLAAILLIGIHASTRCCRFYISVAINMLLGETLLPFVKSILDFSVFMIFILLGTLIIFVLSLTNIPALALAGGLVFAIGFNILAMIVASINFVRMEKE